MSKAIGKATVLHARESATGPTKTRLMSTLALEQMILSGRDRGTACPQPELVFRRPTSQRQGYFCCAEAGNVDICN